jgi:hypothetical protein
MKVSFVRWFLIHPDDFDAFRKFRPQGQVMHCTAEDSDYLTLQHGASQYRVKPDLFKQITPPLHHIDQQVLVRSDATTVSATVCEIMWHFNKQKPYYFLIINGQRSGKRYWDEDLKVDPR